MIDMKPLLLVTSCTAVLITCTAAMASIQRISIQQIFSQGDSVQQTSVQTDDSQNSEIVINVDSANTRQSHILRITTLRDIHLIGEITINDKVVKEFKNEGAILDLSRFLSLGRQTIKISGNYKPVASSIRIEFSGPGTQVSQQTGGSGKLNQTLLVNVQ